MSQPWGIFLFAPGKASIGFFILRIMGPNAKYRKWLLYFLIAMIFIVNSIGCIITLVQCDPPRALWTPGLPAKCWKPTVQLHYNYFLAGEYLLDMFTFLILNRSSVEHYDRRCLGPPTYHNILEHEHEH
jgi:hypothetical protein